MVILHLWSSLHFTELFNAHLFLLSLPKLVSWGKGDLIIIIIVINTVIFVPWMRKLGLREDKQMTQDHADGAGTEMTTLGI